ncbi:hypothetical protein Q6325_27440, partial [Klebsiella pneumoniae]|uniref:hypothetical protein n=1 Tax=Klebsiella pneumoniae TaxID=573 RepID=UPI00272F1D52
ALRKQPEGRVVALYLMTSPRSNMLGLYAQLKPPAPVLAQRAAPGRVRMELSGGATNRGNLPPTRVAQTRDQNLNQEPVVNE